MLKRYSHFIILGVLAVHAILLNGYFYGYGSNYIPFGYNLPPIFERLDPSLYPVDMYVQSSIHQNTFFFDIVAWAGRYIGVEKAAFILCALSLYFILLAIFVLSITLFNSKTTAYCAILMYSMGLRQWTLGEPGIYINTFLDAGIIAYPVLLFALIFFLKRNYYACFALIGIVFNIHLPYALNLLFLFFCFFIFKYRELNLKFICLSFLSLIIPSIPFFSILPSLLKTKHYGEEWLQAVRASEWFHHLPSQWSMGHYLMFFIFLIFFIIAVKHSPRDEKRSTIIILLAALAFLCLMSVIFSEIVPVPFFMQIHVWNYGTWIFYFIAIIYIARLLVSLWENNFIKQFAIAGIFPVTAGYIQPWWFLLLFLIIILSFVYYERFKFISRALTYLTVLFLIYFVCARFMPFLRFENIYIGRFSLFFFTALFIYLLFNKIINAKLSPQISKSIFLISTVIFIIFFDAAFLYKQHGVRINYRGYSKTDINPWVDVQLFARDHTPVDALFIVPPYLEGFTVFSRRSILGDWIIGTTCVWGDNSYAAEWLKRMKMLGWDCSRIVKDFKEVKDNYNSLSKEDILKVAKEYKASYVVFENAKRINLPIIYKNRLYSLYMINEEQNIHKDNEKAGESIRQIITPKDGAKMLLIPAGGFVMGSDKGEDDERPVHDVQLNAFYMDVYEVTNSKYCRFLNENKTSENRLKEWIDIDKDYILIVKSSKGFSAKPGYESYPAVGISWYGAQAYASWAGKRLPTEAEWEYASRGGLRDEQYSWGSQDPSDGARANYNCAKDGYDGVSPAGSFPPNGYGLYDMAGNVWEWCSDWYNSNFYEWSSGFDNWNIILKGTFRVRRGGSCLTDAGSLRNAYRSFGKPLHKAMDVGFRCCR